MAVWRTIVKSSPDVNLPFPTTTPNPALWAAMPIPPLEPKPQIRPQDDMVMRWKVQPYSPALYDQTRGAYPPAFPKLEVERIPPPDPKWVWQVQPYSPALYEQNRNAYPPVFPKLEVERIPLPDVGKMFTPFVPPITVSAYEQNRLAYPPVFPKLEVDHIPVPETTLHWAVQPYSPAMYEQMRMAYPPVFPKLEVDRIPVPETTLHWAVQPYSPAMYEQMKDSLQPGLKKLSPTQIPPADDYGNHYTPFVPIPTVSAYDSPARPPLFPKLEVDRIPLPDTGVTFTPYKPTVPWEAPIDRPLSRRVMQPRQEDLFTAATVVVLNTSWNVSIDVPMQHVTMVRRPEADQQVPAVTRDFGWSATFVMPKVVARSITQVPADLYIAPPLPGNTPDYGWTPMHKPLPGKRNAPEFNAFAIDNAIQTRPITGKTVYFMVSAENRTVNVPAESRTLTVQSEI